MCFSLQWAGTLADDCKQLHDEEVEKRHKFSGRLSEYKSTFINCDNSLRGLCNLM